MHAHAAPQDRICAGDEFRSFTLMPADFDCCFLCEFMVVCSRTSLSLLPKPDEGKVDERMRGG
jgi:hypothetical protein